jgi:hypothetical protein
MSANVSKAMGALGISIGITALTGFAKKASDDHVSMVKLASSIRAATGANEAAITANEAYVQSLSNQLAITDDELRPALEKLVLATGDLETAQALLPMAADFATRAHVDLSVAATALAKAHKGNFTQLKKLMPALIGVNDPMAELQRLTKGAAEEAANSDPFKKLSVIFDNLQETLGAYLLPMLEDFSKWLSTDEGQSKLQMLADGFGMIFTNIGNIISFLSDNQWIVSAVAGLYAMIKVWTIMSKVMKAAYAITKGTTIAQLISNALQGMKGKAAIIAAAAALAGGIALFVTLDNLMGDIPKTNIKPPKRTIVPPPVAGVYDPTKLPGVTGGKGGKGTVKAAQSALTDAIKTVEAKLAEVRQTILNMAAKFFTSVELGFGILDRGASKVFRADRYVRELKRMETALADFKTTWQRSNKSVEHKPHRC